MSSPFQQSFSARSPFGNKGIVTLSEKDIKNAKSASSQPAAEISYEGQGGIDYENDPRFAVNPEGQGGKDYEADDSVAKMNSPLDKAGARGNHGNHMQAGADNSGNPNAATPSEYWRVHQQKSHHRIPPKAEEKKKLKA